MADGEGVVPPETTIATVTVSEGADLWRADIFSLFAAVAGDPTHFGFTNITTLCLNAAGNTVCADPDRTLF